MSNLELSSYPDPLSSKDDKRSDEKMNFMSSTSSSIPQSGPSGELFVIEKYRHLFTQCLGVLPMKEPNVRPGFENEDLRTAINIFPKSKVSKRTSLVLYGVLTAGVWIYRQWKIIPQGYWGFLYDNATGCWRFLGPGNHNIASMFSTEFFMHYANEQYINHGNVHIVRVMQGQIGLGYSDSEPEILMPGLHVRMNPNFKVTKIFELRQEVIWSSPITIFTVNTGTVRIGFENGTIRIFEHGRYAINSPNFVPGPVITMQQLTQKLSNHTVLLDGGISLIVEGLVIYQVTQPITLCAQLGVSLDINDHDGNDLNLNTKLIHRMEGDIEKVTKAEIARVFAGIHLEDISSQSDLDNETPLISKLDNKSEEPEAMLGKKKQKKNRKERR